MERRKDYGKLRLSTKDLTGLDWVATMGTVRLDALTELFRFIDNKEITLEATRKVVQRWIKIGWAEQQVFLKGQPPYVWLTKYGMNQTRYSLPCEMPALALLQHTSDLSFIRLEALRAMPPGVMAVSLDQPCRTVSKFAYRGGLDFGSIREFRE